MQPPQPPSFLGSRDDASHKHPQLDELCSQPRTLTHFDRVLAKIDRTQTLQNQPMQHNHPKSLLYSLQVPQVSCTTSQRIKKSAFFQAQVVCSH
jgi:hypothetical protein